MTKKLRNESFFVEIDHIFHCYDMKDSIICSTLTEKGIRAYKNLRYVTSLPTWINVL